VKVFGTDYETPDGTCVRDYIHVSDLADAHVLALRRLETDGGTGAVNLGNGRGFSVREVIAASEAVTGLRVPVVNAPRRAGDPASLVADASLAGELLGWQPQYTRLEDIIATAWAWHQRR
jgi:UDP-glucose 4-epimerase